MKLLIDSASDTTSIIIREGDNIIANSKIERQPRSQVIMKMIIESMSKIGGKLTNIREIEVNTGPGSFTGLRVGVAIANAIGYGIDAKVNGKQTETELVYT